MANCYGNKSNNHSSYSVLKYRTSSHRFVILYSGVPTASGPEHQTQIELLFKPGTTLTEPCGCCQVVETQDLSACPALCRVSDSVGSKPPNLN